MSAITSSFTPPSAGSDLSESHKQVRDELKKLLSGKLITVITKSMKGLGDIQCAMKIYRYIQEKLQVSEGQLALGIGEDPSISDYNLIPHSSIKERASGILIFAPAHHHAFVASTMNVENSSPTLAISEYGFEPIEQLQRDFENIQAHAFGFTEKSLGYIPSEKLRKWAANKHKETTIDRLSYLKDLPENIQKAIFGSLGIDEFSKTSKLYFGYCHKASSISAFIEAVLTMQETLHDTNNSCFYIMGSTPDFEKIITQTNNFLSTKQIHTATFIDVNKNTVKELTLSGKIKGYKNIKIILGKVPAEHVPAMYMASEEETIVTGDQSLSEAISAEKFPVYETLPHKKILEAQFISLFPSKLKLPRSTSSDTSDLSCASATSIAKFFIQRKSDYAFNKSIEQILRNIAHRFDFSSQFDKALLSAIKKASIPGEKKLHIKLPEAELLAGNEIPLGMKVYVSTDDLIKLKITSDGRSEHPMYKEDSHFKCKRITLELYSLILTKLKPQKHSEKTTDF